MNVMDNKQWFNYVIFSKFKKSYVGSTVNLDRRIRQHNQEIKGGAKYTKSCSNWEYYCVIYNLNNQKNTCLSEEWHIKYFTVRKVKKSFDSFDKRRQAIEMYYKTRPKMSLPYDYVIFISKKFAKNYLPHVDSRTFLMVIDDFSANYITSCIQTINEITQLIKEKDKESIHFD